MFARLTASGIDLSPLVISLVMLSKFGISASFSIIVVYTKELFPTNLRQEAFYFKTFQVKRSIQISDITSSVIR